ncbi:MAG: ABC transporter permease [Gemmatimonadota bacterium]|nr:MAG: ABC transporter permease [Gemmatimonadota bacterium]
MGLWQDIRYGARALLRSPGFTVVVVLILAVGIGANVAMFSIMEMTMIRPLPYPEPERLVLGRATFDGNVNQTASAPDYWDYRDFSTSFEYLAAFWGFTRSHTITGGDRPERVSGIIASIDLFPALGVDPAPGRHFLSDEATANGPPVVIISRRYWMRRYGGSADAVGSTLVLDGLQYEIVGVMPAGFSFYFNEVDVWRPMRPDSDFIGARRFHNWTMLGRLKPDVSIEEAQAEVDVISAQLEAEYPDSNRGKALLLTPLQGAVVEGYRQNLLLVMGAVALVLLIACGNVAGLLLARGSTRRSELSVRSALGASGGRLARLLVTESLVMALAGGVLGTMIAVWLQGAFLQLLSIEPEAVGAGLPISVLLFALAVSLVTGLLFGVAPAIRASRDDLWADLKAGVRTTDAGGTRFRSGLVVAQVAVSVVLLVGAGLLIRSFERVTSIDPGFDTRSLLTAEIRLPGTDYSEVERRVQFYQGLGENVRAIPGVEDVALASQLPFRDPGNNIYVWAADNPPLDPADVLSAYTRTVYPGYFEAMGIPLLAGRGFDETDDAGVSPVMIISKAMADTLFPGQDPVGRQVIVDFGRAVSIEVVGVVGNIKMSTLLGSRLMAFYISYLQQPMFTMRVAVRTAVRPETVTGALREAVWSLDRNIPVADVATMDGLVSRTLATRRVRTVALIVFSGVAVLLATVGLYGVLAYYVTRRFHEIGIRVALGAAGSDIVELVLKRGIVLVAVGLVFGLLGALGVTRLIEELLYQVEPTDPLTFVLVSVFFVLVAVAACLLPAWRAIRVDPLIALQAE